jgi:hypothetical protein
MEMSPHRVSHYITVNSDSDVSRIVKWLLESYEMTKKS